MASVNAGSKSNRTSAREDRAGSQFGGIQFRGRGYKPDVACFDLAQNWIGSRGSRPSPGQASAGMTLNEPRPRVSFNHATRAIRRRIVERKFVRFFCVEVSIW